MSALGPGTISVEKRVEVSYYEKRKRTGAAPCQTITEFSQEGSYVEIIEHDSCYGPTIAF